MKTLRIVTNSATYRVQEKIILQKNSKTWVIVSNVRIIKPYKIKEVNNVNYEEHWYFLSTSGVKLDYDGYCGGKGISYLSVGERFAEFSSKSAATNWIKAKYGQDGLDKLDNGENNWRQV